VIKRTGTLSLPLILTCILSMACSSAAPSGISLAYVRHARNIATPILFQGRVVGVQDGDTITVLDSSNQNHRIRLQRIDAPEKAQAFGTRSGQHLSQAVFDRVVTIEWSKHDRYGRIVGKVTLDGRDICLEQVRDGMAWHYKYYKYYQDEQTLGDQKLYAEAVDSARSAKLGLWIDPDPIPPWDFRHR
jgi:endonuclease YncB( thermonuclease family)